MKRIVLCVGVLLFLAAGVLPVMANDQPGSLVVQGEYMTTTGCLAFLNDAKTLRTEGLCSFSVIAEGVKLTDLECHSKLSGYIGSAILDTIVDCTYSPIRKLSKDPKTPDLKDGETLFPELSLGPDGCLAQVNNPGNMDVLGKCGFNVVLLSLAVPNITCSVKVGGGNTTVACSYPPVDPAAKVKKDK